MSFHALGAAFSARRNIIFRKCLTSTALIAVVLTATCSGSFAQQTGKYFNADGTKTDDFDAAVQSWADDREFNARWTADPGGTPEDKKLHPEVGVKKSDLPQATHLAALKAQYAYARGITGKGIKIGMVDSGFLAIHPDLSAVIPVLTEGVYAANGSLSTGPFQAGTPFSVPGVYDKNINDNHGTHVGGEIAAQRNGKGMMGIAFDSTLYVSNSGGNDGSSYYGPNADYNYFKAAYGNLGAQGVRIINSSWGNPPAIDNYDSKEGLFASYGRLSAQKSWLDGAAEVAQQYGLIQVWASGNAGAANPSIRAALPYFRPELEPYWLAVSGTSFKNGEQGQSGNKCGLAKYFCISTPISAYSTTFSPYAGVPVFGGSSGTSMSAPTAAASLALVMQRYSYMTNAQARDVLLTTAQHLGDGPVDQPNEVYGWGTPDLDKAMKGPGQFLGRFNANLPGGTGDVWNNDISDAALKQRELEEKAELATALRAWPERKKALGYPDGLPADIESKTATAFLPEVTTAKDLLKAAISANVKDNYTAAKLAAALASLKEHPVGAQLLSIYDKANPNWASNHYPWYQTFSAPTDFEQFIAAYPSDASLAAAAASEKFSMLRSEFAVNEARISAISGKVYDGGLTKSGAGSLWLTGKNTYSGATIVDGGLLGISKEGSITSASIVNNTGMLSVDGTAAGVTINAGGTLSVAGDATFDKGSNFDVEISADGANADLLAVSGKTTLLGGVVSVRLEGSPALLNEAEMTDLLGKSHVILTSGGGITGDFEAAKPEYKYLSAVTGSDSAYDRTVRFVEKPKPEITPDVLVPTVQPTVSEAITLNHHIDVGFDAVTTNQKAVAGAINAMDKGDPLYNLVLFTAANEIPDYDALSGEVHATLSGVLAKDADFISNAATSRVRTAFGGVSTKDQAVAAPLAYGPGEKRGSSEAIAAAMPGPATTALWAEAYGSWADADGNGNADGYSRNIGGFVTGLDGIVADSWRLGVLAGYGNTSLNAASGSADVDSYQIGLYGGTQWDRLGLRLGTAFAQNEIETSRDARFMGLSNEHDADYDAQTFVAFGELGYRLDTAHASFEPFAGASYVHVTGGDFAEDGDISGLSGGADATDIGTTTLGIRAARAFELTGTTVLTARGMLGWNHVVGNLTPEASLAFASGQAFSVEGLPIAKDTGIVEAGFDVGIGENTTLGLSYVGQFSKAASDNAVKADLTVRF